MASSRSTATDLLNSFDFADEVDTSTFEQILDMDEDEEGGHDFSKSIVFGFFDSAEATFDKMDEALEKDQNPQYEIGPLAKFIGGSAATTGFALVKESCEKLQNYSKLKDENGQHDIDLSVALKLIKEEVSELKQAFHRVKTMMEKFYATLES